MKIDIDQLEEKQRIKLITDLALGALSHQDVTTGNITFCDECDKWHCNGSFTMCLFNKIMKETSTDTVDAYGYAVKYLKNEK